MKNVDIISRVVGRDTNSMSPGYKGGGYADISGLLEKAVFYDLFEKVNVGTDEAPLWMIKAKYGVFSVKEVSTYGVGKDGGGSGTASALRNLTDVLIVNPKNGQALIFDGTKWVNRNIEEGGLKEFIVKVGDIAYTSVNGVVSIPSYPSLEGYATEIWVQGQHYLTEHQDISHLATTSSMNTALAKKADKAISIIAGKGLSGGGTLEGNRTLNIISANDGITINEDSIQLNVVNVLTSASATQPLSAAQGKALKSAIDQLKSHIDRMFIIQGSGTAADPYVIRANYSLFSVKELSTYGRAKAGGGSGSTGALKDLTDVALSGLKANQGLMYNGYQWANVDYMTAVDTSDTKEYKDIL